MGQVGDLIGAKGAAAAGMLGPAEHPGLKERAIDDQLRAALEQVEQANLTPRPFELVLLLHRHPRHPSTLGCQRITGAGQSLLLLEELLPGSLPLLLRHDRRRLHCEIPFLLFLVSLYACCHLYLLPWVVLRSWLFDYQEPFFVYLFLLIGCAACRYATFATLSGTKAADWRSSALATPLRQPSAMDWDVGSGKISSSPFSMPSKMAAATDSGEAFGKSTLRVISVSTGPVRMAWTVTPWPAKSALSD